MYYHINYQSPIGNMVVACDDEKEHIVGLWIEGQKYFLGSLSEEPVLHSGIAESGGLAGCLLCGKKAGHRAAAPCAAGRGVPAGGLEDTL